MVCYLDMSRHARLTGENAIPSYDCRAGDACLGGHNGVVTDLDIVRYHTEVVEPDAVADDGGLHFGPVNGGAGTDFHVAADDDIAQMLDLLPGAVRLGDVAEAVRSYHAVLVENGAVADDGAGVDADTRMDDAVLTDGAAVFDGDIVLDACAIANLRPAADGYEISDPDLLSESGGEGDAAAEAAAGAVLLPLVSGVLEELCDSRISVIHPHHCGGDRLAGLESLVDQQYAGPAGIYVLLVFGICEEAELSGLAVLYFCE